MKKSNSGIGVVDQMVLNRLMSLHFFFDGFK